MIHDLCEHARALVGMFLVSVTAIMVTHLMIMARMPLSMVGVIMTMVIIFINREIALMLGVTLLT